MERDGPGELIGSVFGMTERNSRHGRVRVGPQVHVRVAEERQDWMIEGRRGELDLFAHRSRRVLRYHQLHDLQLDVPECALVLFGKSSSFGDEP